MFPSSKKCKFSQEIMQFWVHSPGLENVPKLVIDVISLSAVEIVVDKPDAVVEIVDDITLNVSEKSLSQAKCFILQF